VNSRVPTSLMRAHERFGVSMEYDDEADVLYIALGSPQPAIAREDPDIEGLHMLYSVQSGQLCGVTVIWYSRQDKSKLLERIPFSVKLP